MNKQCNRLYVKIDQAEYWKKLRNIVFVFPLISPPDRREGIALKLHIVTSENWRLFWTWNRTLKKKFV